MATRSPQLYNVTGSGTTLATMVRRELEDPATDASGATIPTGQRRYQDTDINDAISFANIQMAQELNLQHPGENLVYADGTYTAGSVSSAWPTGPTRSSPIMKLEDLTLPTQPRTIEFVGLQEIENYQRGTFDGIIYPRAHFRCAFSASGTTPHIIIRPRPTADLAIRAWYIGSPVVWGDNQQNEWSDQWAELIVLRAAKKLARRANEFTTQQEDALQEMAALFRSQANKQRMPQRVRRGRTGRS